MKLSYNTGSRILGVALLAGIWSAGCSSNNNDTGVGGTAGTTGGSTATSSSTGGAKAGGATSTGGTSAKATGGATAAATGGAPAATGGSKATGGTTATATTAATGGAATGGVTSTGTSTAAGGATGGVTSTGTSTTAGGATGGVTSTDTSTTAGGATGGVTSTDTSTTAGGATGGTTSTSTDATGGSTGAAGSTSTSPACTAAYSFDGSDTQGWSVPSSETDVTIAQSTTQVKDGTNSLQVTLPALTTYADADAGATWQSKSISVTPTAAADLYPGTVVKFNIYVPGSTTSLKVQVFSQFNDWNGQDYANPVALTAGSWTEVSYTIPNTLPGGIQQLGLQFAVQNGGTFAGGPVYLDAVSACGGNTSCAGSTTGSINFDTASSTNGFAVGGSPVPTDTTVAQSTAQDQGGGSGGSLLATLTSVPAATSSTIPTCRQIQLADQNNKTVFTMSCGQTVTFYVYTADITNLLVQPYSSQNNWAFNAGTSPTLTASTWTKVTYQIPTTVNSLGLQAVGVQLCNTGTTAYSGTVYIDSVSWQ